ncbi:KRAB-A domain-containing protein 2-like [Scylla paramamosain]|uniref:KRAB-A domain-containing protein 2-like n=1 Tax=Scylla paramamosain TaxID=85552 RepID=UPI0030829537
MVNDQKVLFPPLHIKLGVMKQFDKESAAFKYLQDFFHKLSQAKVKSGIFIVPQVRKIMECSELLQKLTEKEKKAWEGFIAVVHGFLGNKADNYMELVEALVKKLCKVSVGNADRLIRKRKDTSEHEFKFVACVEEVFGIIKTAHEAIGHGGGKKTIAEVRKKWSNITQEVCYLYISFCEHCHQKKARKTPKGLVVKPVRSHDIHSRCQIDLINFQTLPDGNFKYIMTYVNHFSKFCVLRPLTSKRAEEVAANLLDIFLTFGAPAILHSDNGREFVNAIITELSMLWPELKLVTGRPRHPQSQGAVERLNGVIQDKLTIWMRENNSKKWSVGLKFVQWQVNISQHETTGHSPFKVTFGLDPQVGLASSIVPSTAFCNIFTEEDLESFLEAETEAEAETGAEAEAATGAEAEEVLTSYGQDV